MKRGIFLLTFFFLLLGVVGCANDDTAITSETPIINSEEVVLEDEFLEQKRESYPFVEKAIEELQDICKYPASLEIRDVIIEQKEKDKLTIIYFEYSADNDLGNSKINYATYNELTGIDAGNNLTFLDPEIYSPEAQYQEAYKAVNGRDGIRAYNDLGSDMYYYEDVENNGNDSFYIFQMSFEDYVEEGYLYLD